MSIRPEERPIPSAGASPSPPRRLRPSGGYRRTASFQTATLIYDATVWFCEKFLDSRSRTVDQMVQAARSGRQNIAEGSRAAATSSHSELHLLNVARSSLEELLLDFEDYLRHRHLDQWEPEAPEARAVRAVAREGQRSGRSDRSDQSDPARQIPRCPHCGRTMALRTAKSGPHAGRQFWGCTGYPECRGTAEL